MSAVIREHLCPDCANTGQKLHPAWKRLLHAWARAGHRPLAEPSEDFVRCWFWTRERCQPVPRFVLCDCRHDLEILP